ncbi:hypothetical protein MLD38_014856 [Melastoma candidum]|uniref:Uncharacterized protein n=1 Tax=Melastoma candidum TaxID=119954 RepID=A0ACB9RE81_9MYRT|nr:hypothetical protein MLD38_014856 [Melastoma candidum]
MGVSKLKVAGTWSGVIDADVDSMTVPMLRDEVARRSGCQASSINLICGGKVLRDGDGTECLSKLGVKNNSKVLASRACAEEGVALKEELASEEERESRLTRLRAAATALSKRHADGSLPVEDFNIELEDQSGKRVNLGSETDQRAVMMGLMLHANGKQLIKNGKYRDALEVLAMGEESFSLCNPSVIQMVDNVSILQIDTVWCYFMLQDISSISLVETRLEKAREGLERAHGKDFSRVRLLQKGRHPEIALHLRLELLEGVVAYYSGQFEKSRKALTAAQAKFIKLQVSDEALTSVIGMGFKDRDAMRALRMNDQDVGSAVDFLVEERERRLQKREEDAKRRQEILEQKSYGVTPMKKAVDIQRLNELVSIGYERLLAAEALRRNENDTEKALDDLTNPETNAAMQLDIVSKGAKKQRKAEDPTVEQLVSMGFERSRVVEAIRAGGSVEQAMAILLAQPPESVLVDANAASTSVLGNNNNAAGTSENTEDITGVTSNAFGDHEAPVENRDVEMEDEIADELAQNDAFSDYDIDVTKEGEAIAEYLVLLAKAETSQVN